MSLISKDLKAVGIYILTTFLIAFALGLGIYLAGGLRSWVALPSLIGVMFTPLIGAVTAASFITHEGWRAFGLSKGRPIYYLLAMIYPFIIVGLGLLFVALLGTARIVLISLEVVGPVKVPAYIVIVNLALAPLINFIPAFGEEYGWRGFLLTKLTRMYGLTAGLLLTGLVWGLWHAPFILMGLNYPHHPDIVGVGTFTAWCILVGFFLGWLRLKSGSVFPAALAHGAINAYVGLGLLLAPSPDELMTIPLGFPVFPALLIVAIASYLDLKKALKQKAKGEEGSASLASFYTFHILVNNPRSKSNEENTRDQNWV